jgi:O-antigen/teichoic acid export membrane protein
MSDSNDPSPAAPQQQPTLGAQATRGAFWATAPAVLAKLIAFVVDIMLAWFLTSEHFGQIGLSIAVGAVFTTVQQAGLRDILTQRQLRFRRWVTPGFWLSMALGLACTGLMALFAPVAAIVFDERALTGLVLLMSTRLFLDALAIVPHAKLQIELRFRAIGAVWAMTTLMQAGMSVILASPWFGWGAYALAVPMVITSAAQAAAFWYLAKPKVERNLRLVRWRWLMRDGGFAMASGLVMIAIGYGDCFVLGLFYDERVVGVYFFAYRLAVQTVMILSVSLSGVLFSALSRIQQTQARQINAAQNALRVLALVSMPLNGLQAAVAEPLFHVIYGVKWDAAILPFQLLSIAWAMAVLSGPSASLMKAQGRFGAYFWCATTLSTIYIIAISIGAWVGAGVGVAVVVAMCHSAFTVVWLRVAIGPIGGFWRLVGSAIALPLVYVLVAAGAAMWTRQMIPALRESHLFGLMWIGAVTSLLYMLLVRTFMREGWQELLTRLREMRSRSSSAAATAP